MKKKTYDLIKELLTDYPELRDSDRKLQWEVWDHEGFTDSGVLITKSSYMKATDPETIRRTRQKLQQLHPELGSNEKVRKFRKSIADQKGTHIFREVIKEQLNLI